MLITLVLRTTLLLPLIVLSQEVEKTVDQGATAAQAECTNFRLSYGISTNFFYTCCGTVRGETPTVGTQEIVDNWDCNPSRISIARFNETGKYSCNGDAGQAVARDICNARWGWIAAEDCWAWPTCFAGACEKEANQPRSLSLLDGFCGDGRCDASEDTTSCPGDCCPVENPDDCLMKNNTCTEGCCAESTCCVSSVKAFFENFWVIVFSVIGGLFVLINICCCCCCYCFYRKCKGDNKVKRHPSKVDRQDTTMTVLSMK